MPLSHLNTAKNNTVFILQELAFSKILKNIDPEARKKIPDHLKNKCVRPYATAGALTPGRHLASSLIESLKNQNAQIKNSPAIDRETLNAFNNSLEKIDKLKRDNDKNYAGLEKKIIQQKEHVITHLQHIFETVAQANSPKALSISQQILDEIKKENEKIRTLSNESKILSIQLAQIENNIHTTKKEMSPVINRLEIDKLQPPFPTQPLDY